MMVLLWTRFRPYLLSCPRTQSSPFPARHIHSVWTRGSSLPDRSDRDPPPCRPVRPHCSRHYRHTGACLDRCGHRWPGRDRSVGGKGLWLRRRGTKDKRGHEGDTLFRTLSPSCLLELTQTLISSLMVTGATLTAQLSRQSVLRTARVLWTAERRTLRKLCNTTGGHAGCAGETANTGSKYRRQETELTGSTGDKKTDLGHSFDLYIQRNRCSDQSLTDPHHTDRGHRNTLESEPTAELRTKQE